MDSFDILLVTYFFLGYLLIVFEPFVRMDKAGVALLMAVGCWTLFFLHPNLSRTVELADLKEQFGYVSEVVTFLLIILVIIEVVQMHQGFNILTESLSFKSKRVFFWSIGFLTFFLSTM